MTTVKRQTTIYPDIRSFRHKGLKALYDDGTTRYVAAAHVEKLRDILGLLDRARTPSDLNLPGFGLHPLKGRASGAWAARVSGNWRLGFRFLGQDVVAVDYLDYH